MTQLHRRTLLRGAGVAMGLPFFESLLSNRVMGQAPVATEQVRRLACIFMPNGVIVDDWFPKGEGTNFELNKSTKALESLKQDVTFINGLTHDKARANGDGAGDHARCSAAFLTASQPRKTGGTDIKAGVSVDQVAAMALEGKTRLSSLELGTEPGRQAGACDSGYACVYQSNISWRSETVPMAKEVNPRLAFERLFSMSAQDATQKKERDFFRSSILDLVSDSAQSMQNKLGNRDREKLDEYLTSVRDVERRIQQSKAQTPEIPKNFKVPEGVPAEFPEHLRIMYDIMAISFQTDATRVMTFMLGNGGSNRRYTHLNIRGGHHELSHHRNDSKKMGEIQQIDQFLIEEYARFLGKLKAMPEGDSNVLDNSMILLGSGISDANRHRHENLPTIIAGKAGGTISSGRVINAPKETPMANLYVSMLQRVGADVTQFGDSTGALEEIA